jgi:hypothetical protein
MSGAFINEKSKDLIILGKKISNKIKKAETMNLYLNSDIIIKKEDKIYIAYFHVAS